MAKYQAAHIARLRREINSRVDHLESTLRNLPESNIRGKLVVDVDGMSVRMAVEDFKAILAEVKRLK